MSYSSDFLLDKITVLNRTEAVMGELGLDTDGAQWESVMCLSANVEWQRGKSALREGALDAYGVVIVRMRWNNIITMRSRIIYDGQTYQILPETFHADKRDDTLQFLAQVIIND